MRTPNERQVETMRRRDWLQCGGGLAVAIHFNEMTVCDGWDTHSKNFEALKTELLPMIDQSVSALLSDLDQRGRLDETLVMCFGGSWTDTEDISTGRVLTRLL